MAIFHIEGFETLGTTTTTGATLESRINRVPLNNFQEGNGGHIDDIALVSDFESRGLALRMPLALSARGTFVRNEWPAAQKVSTNASHPTIVSGFRYFNADLDPATIRGVWSHMTGSNSLGASLSVAANGVDLSWSDTTGQVTISSVLTKDEWHFIEIEYKPVPSSAGGFFKLHVDGTTVFTSGTRSLTNFTFTQSFGTRVGVQGSANEIGGNRSAFDDWYDLVIDAVHTGPLGPVRVRLLSPTSDASPNTWARSAGANNFALVDETDWVESDYVEATVSGNDDHYGLEALTGTSTVHALQIDAVCRAIDGTPTLHVGFDNGTANEQSGGVIGTATTAVVRRLFTLDPTGSAWNEASVNSVEATQRMTE